jgi:hypothetical protein
MILMMLLVTLCSTSILAVKVDMVSNTPYCLDCETIYSICKDSDMKLSEASFGVNFYKDELKKQQGDKAIFKKDIATLEQMTDTKQVPVYDKRQVTFAVMDNKTMQLKNQTITEDYIKSYETIETSRIDKVKASEIDIENRLMAMKIGECFKLSVKGNLKIGEQVDNVLRIGDTEYKDYAWWNSTFDKRIAINCSLGEVGAPISVNGSNGFDIGAGKNIVWTLCQAGISLYYMSSNVSQYIIANDTAPIPFEVEIGNNSGYMNSSVWINYTMVLHFSAWDTTARIIDSARNNAITQCNASIVWTNETGVFGNSLYNKATGTTKSCFGNADTTAFQLQIFEIELYYKANGTINCGVDAGLWSLQETNGMIQRWSVADKNTFWVYDGSWRIAKGGVCPPIQDWVRFIYQRDKVQLYILENNSVIGTLASSGTASGFATQLGIGGSAVLIGIGYSSLGFYDEFRISNVNRSVAYHTTTWNNRQSMAGYGMLGLNETYDFNVPPPAAINNALTDYDLSSTGNILIMFIIGLLWIGCLTLAFVFKNLGFMVFGLLLGFTLGFMLASVAIWMSLLFFLMNIAMMITYGGKMR